MQLLEKWAKYLLVGKLECQRKQDADTLTLVTGVLVTKISVFFFLIKDFDDIIKVDLYISLVVNRIHRLIIMFCVGNFLNQVTTGDLIYTQKRLFQLFQSFTNKIQKSRLKLLL